MAGEYTLRCDAKDFDVHSGQCASPYYSVDYTSAWSLTPQQGLEIGFAIAGVWCIGLAARVLIRTARVAR